MTHFQDLVGYACSSFVCSSAPIYFRLLFCVCVFVVSFFFFLFFVHGLYIVGYHFNRILYTFILHTIMLYLCKTKVSNITTVITKAVPTLFIFAWNSSYCMNMPAEIMFILYRFMWNPIVDLSHYSICNAVDHHFVTYIYVHICMHSIPLSITSSSPSLSVSPSLPHWFASLPLSISFLRFKFSSSTSSSSTSSLAHIVQHQKLPSNVFGINMTSRDWILDNKQQA